MSDTKTCPFCGHPAATLADEVAHMETAHRDVIAERLRRAGEDASVFEQTGQATELSTDDLGALRRLAVKAMNQERREAEQQIGEDFLSARRRGITPTITDRAAAKLNRVAALRDLNEKLGAIQDDMLVAQDPDGTRFPAAHARRRERHTTGWTPEGLRHV